MSQLSDHVQDFINGCERQNARNGRRKKPTFTLEAGRGETYSSNQPTLYGHHIYERSSVLRGQPRRVFIESWDSWTEARSVVEELKRELRIKVEDMGDEGGSSHIPSDTLMDRAGVPHDEDY